MDARIGADFRDVKVSVLLKNRVVGSAVHDVHGISAMGNRGPIEASYQAWFGRCRLYFRDGNVAAPLKHGGAGFGRRRDHISAM
jgi:hypothetical protein